MNNSEKMKGENTMQAIRCKQCSKDFTITLEEQEWYLERKLDTPKRCKECRERNKAIREGKK